MFKELKELKDDIVKDIKETNEGIKQCEDAGVVYNPFKKAVMKTAMITNNVVSNIAETVSYKTIEWASKHV